MSDTVSAPATTEAPAPSLSLAHIQNAVKAIDYAAEQGVYKGWTTIMQVKQLRDEMEAFAVSVTPPEEAAAEAVEEAAPAPKAKKQKAK